MKQGQIAASTATGDDDEDDGSIDACESMCCSLLCYFCPCCIECCIASCVGYDAVSSTEAGDNDYERTAGHTGVHTNQLYVPVTRIGRGLYEEGSSPSSNPATTVPILLSAEPDGVVGDDDTERVLSVRIDPSFDPELDFYRNFGGDLARKHAYYGRNTPTSFVSLQDQALLEDHFHPPDTTATRAGLDAEERRRRPRDGGPSIDVQIHRVLARYPSAVALEPNIETKRAMIQKFEQYKACFDADNVEDSERAWIALQFARDSRQSAMERISQYQQAITYTNNLTEKGKLRSEYRRFCFALKKQNTAETASTTTAESSAIKTDALI